MAEGATVTIAVMQGPVVCAQIGHPRRIPLTHHTVLLLQAVYEATLRKKLDKSRDGISKMLQQHAHTAMAQQQQQQQHQQMQQRQPVPMVNQQPPQMMQVPQHMISQPQPPQVQQVGSMQMLVQRSRLSCFLGHDDRLRFGCTATGTAGGNQLDNLRCTGPYGACTGAE